MESMVLALLIAVMLSFYAIYYFVRAVMPPRIVTSNRKFSRFLEQHCPVLYRPYWPTFWALQPHIQMIVRVLVQSWPSISMARETFKLSDGGHICLDWCNEKDGDIPDNESCRPTVIIFPGTAGSSDENYVANFLHGLMECNYRSVVFNYRGCGNTGLSTPMLYCAGKVDDMMETIDHIKQRYPKSPLMAVGTSYGGIQTICYLSECYRLQKDPRLVAALIISTPWNLHSVDEALYHPLNQYSINAFLSYQIRQIFIKNENVFLSHKNVPLDYHAATKCYFSRDIEKHIYCPMFGFKDAVAMRDYGSPHHRVSEIRIPLVCLNAEDDPVCVDTPVDDILNNNNIVLVHTSKGGHLGFMEGWLPFGRTLMDHAVIQFSNAVFSNHDLLNQLIS